jgi:hypothetical protein
MDKDNNVITAGNIENLKIPTGTKKIHMTKELIDELIRGAENGR